MQNASMCVKHGLQDRMRDDVGALLQIKAAGILCRLQSTHLKNSVLEKVYCGTSASVSCNVTGSDMMLA